MKTLFGKFGFPLLVLIAITVVLAMRGFIQATPTPSATPCPEPQDMLLVLEIGKGNNFVKLNDPNGDPNHGFNQALDNIKKGQYKIRFQDEQGHIKDCYHPGDRLGGPASIKTDTITTSEVARRAQVQGSAANDPNAMHRIASPDPTEITNVLNTLSP